MHRSVRQIYTLLVKVHDLSVLIGGNVKPGKKGKLCLIKHGSLVISDRDATVLEVDLICFNDELLIRPCKQLGIKSQPTVSLC